MEKSYLRINVKSEKSYLDFLENEWKPMFCQIVKHKTVLLKMCIDERCKATNEQYQLICERCIKENNTHKNANENHKTIDLDSVLSQAIKVAFIS